MRNNGYHFCSWSSRKKKQTKQPFLKLPRSPRFAATTEVASYGFPKETCRILATEQSQRKNTMRGICFILFWGYHPAREQTATFSLCFAQTPNASPASSHSSDTKLLETKNRWKKCITRSAAALGIPDLTKRTCYSWTPPAGIKFQQPQKILVLENCRPTWITDSPWREQRKYMFSKKNG